MISARGLRYTYPDGAFTLAVDAFGARAGEAVAVTGPSGSGKTTLLSLVAGIALPQSGEVTVDGVRVDTLDEPARRAFRLARFGQVFQRVELMEYLSLEENILLPLRLAGATLTDAHRTRARDLLRRVGLGEKAARRPGTLSQGERQRGGICRALIARPPVVLADEPTGSLDSATAGPVLDLFFQLVREEGVTLVCLTHDMSMLPRFDRTVRMADLTGGAR